MSNPIFGPVYSRRFGRSLGIDLSPDTKQCNFDCLYCELQGAKTLGSQNETIPFATLKDAINAALQSYSDIDVITLTANGEPTLYPYLKELITFLKQKPQKKLILTNSSTIYNKQIQQILLELDIVKLSLDCVSKRCFKKLDRAHKGIEVEKIVKGIIEFSKIFTHRLIIEILFVKDINDNKEEIALLNEVLKQIRPARVDIGTIDRPPAYSVKPLTYEELLEISKHFDTSLPINIASRKKTSLKPQSYSEAAILNTLSKRPLTQEDVEILFDQNSQEKLQKLLKEQRVEKIVLADMVFFKTTSNQ